MVELGGSSSAVDKFGNVNYLGTGWDLKVVEAGVETHLIEKAKSGGEVIAQSGFSNGYGDAATSFELTNWGSSAGDATTASMPIGEYVPGGIRIGMGTKDRIVSVVNDDLTGLDEFTVRVIGYRHFA